MAIEIVDSQPEEPLNFNRIFMDKLTVEQVRTPAKTDHPMYKLHIAYRLRAMDGKGNFTYKPKAKSIAIEDFYSVIMADAVAGDMDLVNAFGAIQFAIAKLISRETNQELTVI